MLPERRTRWLLPGMLVMVAIIVWATCATILESPQISPDDFRYLRLAEDAHADTGTADPSRSCIVENRWDHLWFVASEAVVRFWPPTVFASFWVDAFLWGTGDIRGPAADKQPAARGLLSARRTDPVAVAGQRASCLGSLFTSRAAPTTGGCAGWRFRHLLLHCCRRRRQSCCLCCW